MKNLKYCLLPESDCQTCTIANEGLDCQDKSITAPICPDCRIRMGKAGHRLSGKNKRQLWKCATCGKTNCRKPL
jgi:hypothetical protein